MMRAVREIATDMNLDLNPLPLTKKALVIYS